MSRSGWRAIQAVLICASLLLLISVLALPWRSVGIGNPFNLGTKLYQMGLPLLTAALIVIAVGAVLLALVMKPGDRSSIIFIILGAGVILLGLVAQHSGAAGVVIASRNSSHVGLIVAVLAGLLLLGAGVADAVSSRSSSQDDSLTHP